MLQIGYNLKTRRPRCSTIGVAPFFALISEKFLWYNKNMGGPRLTPTEIMQRQASTGAFLPPEVKDIDSRDACPVDGTEEDIYEWIVRQLAATPGGLTVLDDLAIREAAEVTHYYYRVKAKADLAPIMPGKTISPIHGLLKSVRVAKGKAYEAIGLNPKSRTGMRTTKSSGHARGLEDLPDEEDELEVLLNGSEG